MASGHPRFKQWLPGAKTKHRSPKKVLLGSRLMRSSASTLSIPLFVKSKTSIVGVGLDLPLFATGERSDVFDGFEGKDIMPYAEVAQQACNIEDLHQMERVKWLEAIRLSMGKRERSRTPDEKDELRLVEQSAKENEAFWNVRISAGFFDPNAYISMALAHGLQLCSFEQAWALAYYLGRNSQRVGESFLVWCRDPRKKIYPEWDASQVVRVIVTHEEKRIVIHADGRGLIERVQLDLVSYFSQAI